MTYTSHTLQQTPFNGIAIPGTRKQGKPAMPLPNFQQYRRLHYRKSRPCKINILIRRVLRDLNMVKPGKKKTTNVAMISAEGINDDLNPLENSDTQRADT